MCAPRSLVLSSDNERMPLKIHFNFIVKKSKKLNIKYLQQYQNSLFEEKCEIESRANIYQTNK